MTCIVLLILSMACAAAVAQEGRFFKKEVIVQAGLAPVWEAWTTTAGIVTFFSPGADIGSAVGEPFEIWFLPDAPPGERGADGMRILALEPMKMLAFTWNAPPSIPDIRKNGPLTRVTVSFEAVDDQHTRVILVHDRILSGAEWDKYYDYFMKAWDWVLGNLQKRFSDGPLDWSDRS